MSFGPSVAKLFVVLICWFFRQKKDADINSNGQQVMCVFIRTNAEGFIFNFNHPLPVLLDNALQHWPLFKLFDDAVTK